MVISISLHIQPCLSSWVVYPHTVTIWNLGLRSWRPQFCSWGLFVGFWCFFCRLWCVVKFSHHAILCWLGSNLHHYCIWQQGQGLHQYVSVARPTLRVILTDEKIQILSSKLLVLIGFLSCSWKFGSFLPCDGSCATGPQSAFFLFLTVCNLPGGSVAAAGVASLTCSMFHTCLRKSLGAAPSILATDFS